MRRKEVRNRRRSSALSKAHEKTKKIVLVGSTRCGKTALVKRFIGAGFQEQYKATVEDSYFYNYKYNSRHLHIEIVDMPSPFAFPVMRDLHIKAADGVLLVYEIGNELSHMEAMKAWERIRELRDALPLVIVGTKQDFMSVKQNIEELMTDNTMHSACNDKTTNCSDVPHILTSAKDDVGVKEAFDWCLQEMSLTFNESSDSDSSDGVEIGCCGLCFE